MMTVVYDIETRSLDLNSPVWCLFLSINDEEPVGYSEYTFGDLRPISEAFELMKQADELWGWNNLSFDSVVLNYRYGVNFKNERDGLIASRLIWSTDELLESDYQDKSIPTALKGSHSLAAFGHRLDNLKLSNEDFSQLSANMLEYCAQDVNLTRELVKIIKQDEYQPSHNVVQLEEQAARIVASQSIYGWNIDTPAMNSLKTKLEKDMLKTRFDLRKVFKPKFFADGKEKVLKFSKTGKPLYRSTGLKVIDTFSEEEEDV